MRPRSLNPQRQQSSPARRAAVAVFALGLTLAATACAGHRTGTAGPQSSTNPAVTSPSTAPATSPVPSGTAAVTGTWHMLPKAPLAASGYEAVWTGKEMLLYQPNLALDADRPTTGSIGAGYDPTTDTWRTLPSNGLPVASVEGGYHAVWDGTEMLTWGMQNAAYNPATNRWRALGGPGLYAPSVVVWTGRQVLMWGGGCCGDFQNRGAAYTPATNAWQPLPAAPLTGRHTSGAWTGSELVLVGGYNEEEGALADAAAYSPTTRAWRKLPSMPAVRMEATATWTGTEVLVVGGTGADLSVPSADALAYNPATDRWRSLPSMGGSRVGHVSVWTGDRLLVWGGKTIVKPPSAQNAAAYRTPAHGMAYDPAANRWSPMPAAPLRARGGARASWTGNVMLIWGGYSFDDPPAVLADGAAYRPA